MPFLIFFFPFSFFSLPFFSFLHFFIFLSSPCSQRTPSASLIRSQRHPLSIRRWQAPASLLYRRPSASAPPPAPSATVRCPTAQAPSTTSPPVPSTASLHLAPYSPSAAVRQPQRYRLPAPALPPSAAGHGGQKGQLPLRPRVKSSQFFRLPLHQKSSRERIFRSSWTGAVLFVPFGRASPEAGGGTGGKALE